MSEPSANRKQKRRTIEEQLFLYIELLTANKPLISDIAAVTVLLAAWSVMVLGMIALFD